MDPLADVKKRARKKYLAAIRRHRRYCIRYFIVWPPPHPGRLVRQDRSMWYWNERQGTWGVKEVATAFETRAEADERSFLAAVAITDLTPGGEALGKVRASRQLVRLVREDTD